MNDSPLASAGTVPVALIGTDKLDSWIAERPDAAFLAAWLKSTGFTGAAGTTALIPGTAGQLAIAIQGTGTEPLLWAAAGLPESLPQGSYRFDDETLARLGSEQVGQAALGWALGSYAFTRYKARKRPFAELVLPDGFDRAGIDRLAEGICFARALIDTPAEEMGPAELADAASDVAARCGASIEIIAGDELLARNYPLIHAVGRASARPPRLIDIIWGDPGAPKLTLVGKGVCFDTGGLDIKPSSGMKLMKKDMGGAATVLGLAQAIMQARLPVRLRVLVPAVENSISANAYRASDVFRSRSGKTVEIGNTDAEGRLILADALSEASAEKPEWLIDMATLTGAARVALGQEIPALFSNDDGLASALLDAGGATGDPLWRLPLWAPYRKQLDSRIADINSAPDGGMGGAITAALFLETFVEKGVPWAHIDSYAWNAAARPGRPAGGEALGLRALYQAITTRFAG